MNQTACSPNSISNKHASAAAALVNQSWFPVNPAILLHIREAFESGRYESDATLLIEDLKGDAALFLYVLRELQKFTKDCDADDSSIRSGLEKIGLQKAREILTVMPSAISHHEFRRMNKRQSQLLLENLKAACISESLAAGQNIDKDLVFSAALLRQLGLTLIAWNYPHIFERAAANSQNALERDESLTKMLGFSPATLAITLARKWELDIHYRAPLGDYQSFGRRGAAEFNLERVGRNIEKICRIGEILARASQPEYCEPRSDWHRARNEILRSLGAQGFKLIEERTQLLLCFYKDSLPEHFSDDCFTPVSGESSSSTGHQLFHANQYIKHLSPVLQRKMHDLYESIDSKSVSKSSIDQLVGQIIPQAGFTKGCIYLIDPGFGWLVPRLAIGESSLTDYKSFSPGFLSIVDNPLASAYRLSTPVIETVSEGGREQVVFIAGAVGSLQKAGVLYLEPGPTLLELTASDLSVIFKAMRNCLADCLTLT
ncbi:MAG: HDOD domain-containing protein [Deltaproteobacteria bacterium]|nr:HDOD domain-containing protein [Deltaproteobacteria bacterium]